MNDKARMTNSITHVDRPNEFGTEFPKSAATGGDHTIGDVVIRHWSFIRHSDFDIRYSSKPQLAGRERTRCAKEVSGSVIPWTPSIEGAP